MSSYVAWEVAIPFIILGILFGVVLYRCLRRKFKNGAAPRQPLIPRSELDEIVKEATTIGKSARRIESRVKFLEELAEERVSSSTPPRKERDG